MRIETQSIEISSPHPLGKHCDRLIFFWIWQYFPQVNPNFTSPIVCNITQNCEKMNTCRINSRFYISFFLPSLLKILRPNQRVLVFSTSIFLEKWLIQYIISFFTTLSKPLVYVAAKERRCNPTAQLLSRHGLDFEKVTRKCNSALQCDVATIFFSYLFPYPRSSLILRVLALLPDFLQKNYACCPVVSCPFFFLVTHTLFFTVIFLKMIDREP